LSFLLFPQGGQSPLDGLLVKLFVAG